jgi:hypothetical protein
MNWKSLFIAAGLITTLSITTKAQDEEGGPKGFDRNKLFFGGQFGLSFGSYNTLVNLSPQIGYRFNQYLAAGAGVNFLYSSYKYAGYKANYGVTGLNIFGRVYPIEYAFLQLQPEMNYTWGKYKYDDGSEQKLDGKLVPSLLGGVGAAIPAGRGAFIVLVEYDLLQNNRTPYGNKAFFNFGYNIGF